jgi:hypothetical protein
MSRSRRDLIEMLARSLGAEAAQAHVVRAADRLGLGQEIGPAEALRVFEELTNEPGLVGVAARFAKARLHLQGA